MNIKKIKADFEKKHGYLLMPAGIDENHNVPKYIKILEKIIKDYNKVSKNIERLNKKFK
jgi:predicted methyltransferase MtxX (methanogen marker protein 4)